MGIFGIAKKGLGLLGKKKKKKKTFLDRSESKVIKRIKQRKRDDAIFKGIMGGTAATGYIGIKLETTMRDSEKMRKAQKKKSK
tara:strand:- start:668 stop:916 length:249 start_codon:yes stop_codon:yes gene_type:complete